jgi:DNA-binding CsgD family transcriptional regulator
MPHAECEAAHQQLSRAATGRMRALYRRLSPREARVFAGVVSDKLNKPIASDLGIALRTVKLHRTHISRKLGMASVAEWVQLWNALERRPGCDRGSRRLTGPAAREFPPEPGWVGPGSGLSQQTIGRGPENPAPVAAARRPMAVPPAPWGSGGSGERR